MLKYGARVYPLKSDADIVLVKQTVQRKEGGEYVVDEQRERHVSLADDAAVSAAIRDALVGQLPSQGEKKRKV
jgi:hypothetical protein